MGKSARALGNEFGKTAQEMHKLLKEHNYLEGEPGAYRLTEKGSRYAKDHHRSNRYGGLARREWETRTWNDDLAGALRADIEKPRKCRRNSAETSEEIHEPEAENESFWDHGSNDTPSPLDGRKLIIVGAIVVATCVVAPYMKPFYENRVKPAAQQLRDKIIKQEIPDDQQALEEETIVSSPASNEEFFGVERKDE